MAYKSPSPTPERTPRQPQIVEASSPWYEVPVKKYGGAKHGTFRTPSRNLSRLFWLTILLMMGVWWAVRLGKVGGAISEDDEYYNKLASQQLKHDGLQFIDATHPYIRYVGRWASSLDGMHKDGSFPGVYFDFAFNGSTSVFVSLRNSKHRGRSPSQQSTKVSPEITAFLLTNTSRAGPISILARIDDDEYRVLPNATSIVALRVKDLDSHTRHDIRIIAPMVGDQAVETLQIEGIWIDEAGQLLPYTISHSSSDEAVNPSQVAATAFASAIVQRKMLEIVTDLPGSRAGRDRHNDIGTIRGIVNGVTGWEFLIGEMFGSAVDHVTIGMEGMCLVQDCIGGTGSPAGLADVFFQSGPVGSNQYDQPWSFQDYIPDLLVMNIGNSDWHSFQNFNDEYNKTSWELSVSFEETYISMIKTIRMLAYPKHSNSLIDSQYLHYSSSRRSTSDIPIFIMRPFRGQLEHATYSVVERLRRDGDRAVFWIDTSGWALTEVDLNGRVEDQDFFLDEGCQQWRLTDRGNQKVAFWLHSHVCSYLAREPDKCEMPSPEMYRFPVGGDYW